MGETLLNTEAAPTQLRHEGVPYSGPAALVPTASALVVDSVRAGYACMVLAQQAKLDAIRTSVGDDVDSVSYFDMSVQGRNPARVLPALQSFVDHHRGAPMRMIAEPFPADSSAATRTEVEINELIFSLPGYRTWQATMTCLYDTTAVDRAMSEALEAAHGEQLAAEEAGAQLARRFAEALPTAPYHAKRAGADLTTLGDLRQTIASLCRVADLGAERTDDFVYAVNEVVTNSICHGEGRARVLLWHDAAAVWCEVHDRGRITDPLVGRVAPRTGQVTGRGLWLVNQLCDFVQVRSSGAGTFVRMSVDF